jgi:hypothetical protein
MSQGRRVRRIVRSVDAGSVLKIAVLFWATMWVVVVLAGVILWTAASQLGVQSNISSFMENVGFDGFVLHGGAMLRGAMLGGAVVAAVAVTLTVLAVVLFNLLCDLVGGVEFTVLEEVRPVAWEAERVNAQTPVWAANRNEHAAEGRVSSSRSGL